MTKILPLQPLRSRIQSQAIFLSFVPLAFLLVFLAIVALLVDRTAELTIWTQHASNILDRSDAILKTLGDANEAVVAYSTHPQQKTIVRYQILATSLRKQTRELVQLTTDPSQGPRAARYAGLTNRILAVLDAYLADVRSGQRTRARALGLAASTRALAANFQTAKADFDRTERQLTSVRFRTLRGQVQTYGFILLILTFAGIVLTLLTTARFGVRMANRLQQLADNARRLGSGEATTPVEGSDEIADLDRIYHQMAQRIHDTLSAYKREHYIASTLQQALLPQELPRVEGLRIDTAYQAAAHAADIGGDWYDVFKLNGRIVGISIGDVGGHGLRAAAVMGSVRQIIRTAARLDSEPGSVLNRVNRALCADEQDVIVSAFFATLDLHDGSMRYAVAGHPLPLALRAENRIESLPGEGLILGVDPRAKFETFEERFRPGEAIIAFTDGIIEIQRDYLKGMDNFIAVVREEYARASSGNIAEAIKDRILSNATPLDDSAILFIGITNVGDKPSVRERTWTIDARERGAAYRVRRALVWDLAKLASPESDLEAVELILGELLSNVALHTPGRAEVTLRCSDGHASLQVCDAGGTFKSDGQQLPGPMESGGRGLFLVRTLSRQLQIGQKNGGNCISVTLPVDLQAAV